MGTLCYADYNYTIRCCISLLTNKHMMRTFDDEGSLEVGAHDKMFVIILDFEIQNLFSQDQLFKFCAKVATMFVKT